MSKLESQLGNAVRHSWQTRLRQGSAQGSRSGVKDAGNRALATGGKHLDGLNSLLKNLVQQAGIEESCIHTDTPAGLTLPGFFRPTKRWDLVVVVKGHLLAAIECKALCGPSFGNNFNNRMEEAVGCALTSGPPIASGRLAIHSDHF